MGIDLDYHVEIKQQKYEESLRHEIAKIAAIYIVNGKGRSYSIEEAEKRVAEQHIAFLTGAYTKGEKGVVCFYDLSLESLAIPRGKEALVNVIKEELLEHF